MMYCLTQFDDVKYGGFLKYPKNVICLFIKANLRHHSTFIFPFESGKYQNQWKILQSF